VVYIPEDTIKSIKNTADIVEIISETVILKKTGKNFLGLCPFHSEKTPSFTVSPDKQIFFCFGCRAGGNVFSFLMKQDGLQFPEAAKMLARRYGIEVPTEKPTAAQAERVNQRERLLVINRQARDFFHHCLLKDSSGKQGREYLQRRQITREVVENFQLGYAPEGWDNLLNYFTKKRISPKLLEKAGLVLLKKNQKGHYDRFRNRIIFPILDVSNQVIGFGGRVLDDALPKYLNSPETAVYNKSRSLYGLNRAKSHCRKSGKVYIVEGYFDLLTLHQNGIENSVATLGTALTSEHLRVLKGFAEQAVLIFDSDEAGIKASKRSTGLFRQESVEGRIVVLPTGYDPDAFLRERGAEGFEQAASESLGVMAFLMQSAEKRYGLSIEGKIRIVEEMIAPLSMIGDKVARSLHIKKLAEWIGIDETAIIEKVRRALERNTRQGDRSSDPVHSLAAKGGGSSDLAQEMHTDQEGGSDSRLESKIVAMMLQYPEIIGEIIDKQVLGHFSDDCLKSIGEAVVACEKYTTNQITDIINQMEDPKSKSIVAALSIQDDSWEYEGCRRLIAQFLDSRTRRQNNLLHKIRAAEESNNLELLLELLKKKQNQARDRQGSNLTSAGG